MKNKLVYVGFAYLHHKYTHAGYHQIKNYLKYDYYVDCQSWFDEAHIESNNLYSRIKRRFYRLFFDEPAFPWFVLKIIILGLLHNNLTFHFIYAENNFFPVLKKFIRKGNKCVCTFHQPLDFFESRPCQMQKLKSADEIILVGKVEIEKFEAVTKRRNVKFIPHGICSDFYCPDNTVRKEKMVLTVGNWLRDFEFADKVYQRLLNYDKDINIVIVSNPKNKTYVTPNDRIHFLSGISDEELRELYRKCSVLFLPLTRYTANNSLLEAGSTGCNIVIASDNADNSYIPEEYLTLVPMDESKVIEMIMNVMTASRYTEISDFVSGKYSWVKIASATEIVLD